MIHFERRSNNRPQKQCANEAFEQTHAVHRAFVIAGPIECRRSEHCDTTVERATAPRREQQSEDDGKRRGPRLENGGPRRFAPGSRDELGVAAGRSTEYEQVQLFECEPAGPCRKAAKRQKRGNYGQPRERQSPAKRDPAKERGDGQGRRYRIVPCNYYAGGGT